MKVSNKIIGIFNKLVLGVVISFLPVMVYALDLSIPKDIELPDIGDPSSTVMSTSEEQHLGVELYRHLRNTRKVVEDPELYAWIRSLGNQLVANAPGANSGFYFLIIDDPSMNAFAMPGGVIAVHSGLILQTDTESELVAVLSHEIAHVTQRHIARRLADNKNKALISGLGALAGAVAATQNPELGQAVMTSSLAAQQQTQLNFSRQAETEADRIGMNIMRKSGYDLNGMAAFMEKLDRQRSRRYQDIGKYLSTHPLSIERLSDIKSRLPVQQSGRINSIDYQYAKAKLHALTQTSLKSQPIKYEKRINNYFQAWQSLNANQYQTVIRLLANTAHDRQEAVALSMAYNQAAKAEESIRLLEPFVKSYPGEEALVIPLAEAYLLTGKVAKAWQLIKGIYVSEQTSLVFLEKKQMVANRAGKVAEALLAVAERYVRLGLYEQAKSVLTQAMKHRGVVSSDAARMQWLLGEIGKIEQ